MFPLISIIMSGGDALKARGERDIIREGGTITSKTASNIDAA